MGLEVQDLPEWWIWELEPDELERLLVVVTAYPMTG